MPRIARSRRLLLCALFFPALVLGGVATLALAQEDETPTPFDPASLPEEQRAAWERYLALTRPSEAHRDLARFLGEWDTTTRMFLMPGGEPSEERGTAVGEWLFEGRYVTVRTTGTLMGMPFEDFLLLGYDNFKQCYTGVVANTQSTALLAFEGAFDRERKRLECYGTMDEPLTGELDKMVRYVWRFVDEDHFTVEVHDLRIGEPNTKVVEVAFTRRR